MQRNSFLWSDVSKTFEMVVSAALVFKSALWSRRVQSLGLRVESKEWAMGEDKEEHPPGRFIV